MLIARLLDFSRPAARARAAGLAAGLIGRPDVLFLDEPTGLIMLAFGAVLGFRSAAGPLAHVAALAPVMCSRSPCAGCSPRWR